ncbi:MAG: SdrD B-like domain-containing protein, partial [Thermoanaerobaculia bacterium]
MLSSRLKSCALAALLLAAPAAAQIGPGPFAVFPTQSTTDARFLGFGCPGTATFEQNVVMGMAVPADQASFTVSLFDGDTGKTDAAGRRHWDLGTRQIVFRVYADPLRRLDTSPANLVGTWKGNDPNPLSGPGWTVSSATMPDNDWWGATITNTPSAKAPSGNYFYTLEIGLDGACTTGESLESNLKIAASNPMAFLVPRFGLVAAMRQSANDGPIIYPGGFPPLGNNFLGAATTYDGTFEFFLSLNPGETDLKLYDGDFDFGTGGLTASPSAIGLSLCTDNDDPDTPSTYADFPFGTAGVTPEGARGPGSPADDSIFDAFRRGEPGSPLRLGCVRYEVTDPNGTVYRNDNPSGSFEWEQFRIATPLAFDPNNADYTTTTDYLPTGIWKVRLVGLDRSNLNFFFADACSTRVENGQNVPACPHVSVYLLGNTVWLDSNGNGQQDPGEPGIPGVTLKITRVSTALEIGSATTADSSPDNWAACQVNNTGLDELGLYCFGVDDPGDYFVEVAPENFLPGGPLHGYATTTGTQHTDTLVDGNVLTYNFGFRPNGSIGDRLWLDADGDGAQDAGELGLAG